jgi:flagellar L-ring protein precursor FlgH
MTSPSRLLPAALGRAVSATCVAAVLAGCGGVQHVGKYQPRQRQYDVAASSEQAAQQPSPGSLWQDNRSTLFTDARAFREQDLVVVKIEEIADAKRSSDTDLTRQSAASGGFSANLDAKAVIPAFDGKLSSDSKFKGTGSTGRTERLIATVPAVVRKVLPNGNLFIEGHRVVLVNNEEQHFYVSGVVRPIDIDGENSVKSSLVADAEIEFTGRGVLSENQSKGWAQKYLGWIWPF